MTTSLRKPAPVWLLATLLLPPAFTYAETPVRTWVQCYNGPANAVDQPTALAIDSGNNVIVTGYGAGIGSSYDYVTLKYSSAGAPLWTNCYNGFTMPLFTIDKASGVAVDGNDDVIVTGSSLNLTSYPDYATVKYSSAGVPLWTNRYNGFSGAGHSTDEPSAVAVDRDNHVIVTGASYGSGGNTDYATIKYSSSGAPLWTNRYNGPGNSWDNATALVVDHSNDVLVTGHSMGSGYNSDYATVKYSSAGVPLWTNRFNGPGNLSDVACALAVDSNNDVSVTGSSLDNASRCDYVTIKYSSGGVPLWTNRYIGPGNHDDVPTDIAVDASNNVIVTGVSGPSGATNFATIKYSSEGVPLWTNRSSGSGGAYGLAVDSCGDVIVTGYSYFPGSGSYNDYATVKYSSGGAPLWTNCYSGPPNGANYACAVAVDHRGNVIVTGHSTDSGGNADFATVKYICVPPPVTTGLSRTNGTFQLRVDDVLQPGTLVVEASTNLTGWAPIFTNTTLTNVIFYTDPDAGSLPTRFYRAFQFP